jgi:hypothetical protein
MIPWRTGKKGKWLLSDRFEEIYLDDFARDKVTFYFRKMLISQIVHLTGKHVEYLVRKERISRPGTSNLPTSQVYQATLHTKLMS